MQSIQHLFVRSTMAFLLRMAFCGCVWTLLTEVTEAAEIHHHSFGEEIFHLLTLNLYSVMMAVWVFILGTCIGSFLNVVIFRMPAGMALSHPGSRCPVCETELTARDNIPILGWMTLRGRCRYCQHPISPRYPLIEVTVGLLFLILLLVETRTGAANLPLLEPINVHGVAFSSIFQEGHWELLGWLVVHGFHLTLVLAVCMIGFDGHDPPPRLIHVGIIIGLITGVFWPEVRPIHVLHSMSESVVRFPNFGWTLPPLPGGRIVTMGISFMGIADGLAGMASGLLTGRLAGQAVSRFSSLAMTVRGVFLLSGVIGGWQMTWPMLAIVLLSIGVLKFFRAETQRKLLSLILFGTCSVLILAWSQLLNGIVLIGYNGWRWTTAAAWVDWIVTIGTLMLLALMLSRFQSHQPAAP